MWKGRWGRGERGGSTLDESGAGKYPLDCPLAYDLIHVLSVIVGTCDLMAQKTPESSPTLQPMLLMRNVARSMAADLGQFQCDLARLRSTNLSVPANGGTGTRS
jgi:hypothetical protein